MKIVVTGYPAGDAIRVPIDEWLFDPADAAREVVGLGGLLGVEVLRRRRQR